MEHEPNCLHCQAPIEAKPHAGQPKRFCSASHGVIYRRNHIGPAFRQVARRNDVHFTKEEHDE